MTTNLHHLNLLELLDGRGNVAQRSLAEGMGMSASQVNRILRRLTDDGLVEVVDEAVRPFAYRLTREGRAHRRELDHRHVRSVVGSYRQVQTRIRRQFQGLRAEGVRRVVFYGAGQIMETAYPLAEEAGLEVVGIVDDNPARHGPRPDGSEVQGPEAIECLRPCAVVITTFRHSERISERLERLSPPRVVEL